MTTLTTILHVDDDEDILEIARMALQLVDNFDLYQCNSGPKALEMLDDVKPQLLLLDVMMPSMTGPDLFDIVRSNERHRDIPAIFMTAKAEDEMSKKLLEGGALDVFTKPFDPMTLGSQIRTVWAKREKEIANCKT
ncbi:response regulator [Marivita sp.]|uniref:response regulator n=1 Tax=Marivita sp. TaxID=2003365 RepID=UPI003F71761F